MDNDGPDQPAHLRSLNRVSDDNLQSHWILYITAYKTNKCVTTD